MLSDAQVARIGIAVQEDGGRLPNLILEGVAREVWHRNNDLLRTRLLPNPWLRTSRPHPGSSFFATFSHQSCLVQLTWIILYYTMFCCIILYCAIFYCIILWYTICRISMAFLGAGISDPARKRWGELVGNLRCQEPAWLACSSWNSNGCNHGNCR